MRSLLMIGLALITIGLIWDPKNAGLNLLAEAAGVVGGSFLTLTLIESYLERRESERWTPVLALTRRALVPLVADVSTEFYFLALDIHDRNEQSKIGKPNERPETFELPIGILQMENRFAPTADGERVIEDLIGFLRRFESVVSPYDLFRNIAPYLNQFRVHMARFLDMGRDPTLIQILLEVEEAETRLAKQSEIDDATGWRVPNLAAALDLLERLLALYRHLLSV